MAQPANAGRFRVMTYIDGFNLYFGLREQGWRRYMWLDPPALSRSLLRPDQDLLLTKYFTSRVSGNPGKEQRQSAWLDAIGTLAGLNIYWGRFQADRKECKNCHSVAFVPQEKKTDVNIATELLCDAHSDAFDTAIVISGDADLVPPIAAIRRLFPLKKIVVAFPPCRYSAELALNANASIRIYESYFRKSRLPETVTLASGTNVVRPSKWA
jgi:uncharacterized LabA/DUF88 family protein